MYVEVLTPVAQTVMLFGNKVVTNVIKVILKYDMGVGLDGLWGPFHLYISLTLTWLQSQLVPRNKVPCSNQIQFFLLFLHSGRFLDPSNLGQHSLKFLLIKRNLKYPFSLTGTKGSHNNPHLTQMENEAQGN